MNAHLVSWAYLSSLLGGFAVAVAQKSVQLVRVSSFRSDFLQNPYFNNHFLYLFQVMDQDFIAEKECYSDKDCIAANDRFKQKCTDPRHCGNASQPFKCDFKFHRCLSGRVHLWYDFQLLTSYNKHPSKGFIDNQKLAHKVYNRVDQQCCPGGNCPVSGYSG